MSLPLRIKGFFFFAKCVATVCLFYQLTVDRCADARQGVVQKNGHLACRLVGSSARLKYPITLWQM